MFAPFSLSRPYNHPFNLFIFEVLLLPKLNALFFALQLITRQFVPISGTLIYDAINCSTTILSFKL